MCIGFSKALGVLGLLGAEPFTNFLVGAQASWGLNCDSSVFTAA
jgi:hypothetical protein